MHPRRCRCLYSVTPLPLLSSFRLFSFSPSPTKLDPETARRIPRTEACCVSLCCPSLGKTGPRDRSRVSEIPRFRFPQLSCLLEHVRSRNHAREGRGHHQQSMSNLNGLPRESRETERKGREKGIGKRKILGFRDEWSRPDRVCKLPKTHQHPYDERQAGGLAGTEISTMLHGSS